MHLKQDCQKFSSIFKGLVPKSDGLMRAGYLANSHCSKLLTIWTVHMFLGTESSAFPSSSLCNRKLYKGIQPFSVLSLQHSVWDISFPF